MRFYYKFIFHLSVNYFIRTLLSRTKWPRIAQYSLEELLTLVAGGETGASKNEIQAQ
jgi:hypothetical protein